ncbi:peptidase M28 [Aliidiomarina sedimenti]|uniref:Peptidase M28 n=1 Tax=Aliidiomarina sedimenti TaxID=1933879 RepID=A0ABY0BXK8_9GAMM|nr:M28 family metallopeptidase [Aliidiomarina sedimenti]RUO29157.1 peptidase M28 [Aliidiomarina sedimenti]
MRQLVTSTLVCSALLACTPTSGPDEPKTASQFPLVEDADGYFDTDFSTTYREHLRTLASDEFEGRAPGTRGEELTIDYITNVFQQAGVQSLSGTEGDYTQMVPMVRIAPTRVTDMTLRGGEAEETLAYRQQMMGWTHRAVNEVEIADSEMVFVGYGIVAPEYDWNDYEGLDVEGKTVVMLVNDPGYATQDEALFNGNSMTYYGRWTYKFEEAARQGADAAIIVHETGPAGYGWGVVAGGSPIRYSMKSEDMNAGRAKVEGWITEDSAEQLFANVGMTLDQARTQALAADFEPLPLQRELSLIIENEIEYFETANLIGQVEGSRYPDEHVIYMAHWDHMGVEPISGEVFNGAQDNASGAAALLALAEKFAAIEQPERTVVFAMVGAEERGLLGSKWYAENPLLPLDQAVAGINMDMQNMYGPVRDFVVVGWDNSEMQDIAAPYVEAQQRYLAPETNPERGFFYRSDHFSLANKGVPMLYAKGGIDHFEFGKDYGREKFDYLFAELYHKPADEYDPEWDLRGMQQDLWIYFRVGHELVNSRTWPAWREGNEFEAERLQTESQRSQ